MISRYRVIRRLGAGGMGEVLLAQDPNLERAVAIKVMSTALAKDPAQRKRFRQEAKAASGLVHPNICVIHEVGETEDGLLFLPMEFVEGQTLDRVMVQRRLRLREIIHIGMQVADALEAARVRGIVHRDIKPANILLDARGHVKVLDFGLAKRFAPDTLGEFDESSVLHTATGILIGTPHYMSPEQALGHAVDHRSDIFSLGVVLYELAAGQKPFVAKTVGETINLIVNQKPEPLGLENPIYTPGFDAIVFKCLEKEPDKRYSTAKELASDLQKLKEESERATALAKESVAVPASQGAKPVPPPRARHFPGAQLAMAALALVILGLGYSLWTKSRSGSQLAEGPKERNATFAQQKSIAVLPFDNFSEEKDSDYLSDGLTEEITTALSRIPGLKVMARNSAFTFKGHKEDLRKVGATLGVTTLLEGSLRKAGRQMRITAQLINAADGYHLWSETYDRSADDIFAVQDEIARKIAERLQVDTTSSQQTSIRPRAVNMEAHEIYLRARHFWNQRGKENLERAAQLFKEAIDKDPNYAAAHAGLALTYAILPDYASRPVDEYLPFTRAAANKALEFDPSSAEAQAAFFLISLHSFAYQEAERRIKKAIVLSPNYATAHQWYGNMMGEFGRLEEAEVELNRAEELDPLSPIIKSHRLLLYMYARRFDEGIKESRKALQLFPEFPILHASLGFFYDAKGMYREALAEHRKARAGASTGPWFASAIAYDLARAGDEAGARKILAELYDWKAQGYTADTEISVAHLALREYDQAITSMESALEAKEQITGLLLDPLLDELRTHPRFPVVVKKARLEPYWKPDVVAAKK